MPSAKSTQAKKQRDQVASLRALEKLAEEGEFLDKQNKESAAAKSRQQGRLNSTPEDKLGVRLQETRESMRMTQGELAALTASLDSEEKGISRAVISLYEKGKNRPSPKELRLLCEALKITPNYLIYGDEHPFDSSADYERLGTVARRGDPEGFAWMAYVMSIIHHNHYDAVMKLVLDLARGWNKSFDQGLQPKANEQLLAMADELRDRLALRAKLAGKPTKK
ncbi:helix-turn-helix domain-containing protein [Hydrogenophaga sp.]|uniref:helix-turn-helix domain-containing protein n=1 Tax=Hydrogenophaga sp. TaxID=1904254 RepID=UPI003F716665